MKLITSSNSGLSKHEFDELLFLKEQLLSLPVGGVVTKDSEGGFTVQDRMLVVSDELVKQMKAAAMEVQDLPEGCDICDRIKVIIRLLAWTMEKAA